jgi:hypothetical protein
MDMTETGSGTSSHDDEPTSQVSFDGPGATDDVDLQSSLTSLSRLAMGQGQQGLEDLLQHVAEYAVAAIPGADGAGLTLLEADRVDTMVASADFVREVDAIQYGIGEGPCITAAASGRTVHSGSLGSDMLWPRFGPRVVRLGVHSVLSLPLVVGTDVLGAMNVYAHAKDAFDERSVQLGELFSVPGGDLGAECASPRSSPAARRPTAGGADKPRGHRSGVGDRDEPRWLHRRGRV